ncbi:hypothetical protein ACSBR2_015816 [Camellia fascicularis]
MGEEEAEQEQKQKKQQSNSEMEEMTAKESREQVVEDYSWPVIRFDVPPVRTYHFCYQFRNTSSNPNNFPYGIKWSPDGSCFLTCTDEKSLRVFPLPDAGSVYYENSCSFAADVAADSYSANLVLNEGEPVYDFCWYPYMSASDPVTCVFASTTRDHPIHLWDATSGELRCTYRAYNDVDEITAAYCIGFNPAGTKIFAGYNKSLRIFYIHRPGRDSVHHSTVKGNNQQPVILGCLPRVPMVKLLQSIGKIIWNSCTSYMANKVGLHMCNSQKMVTIYIQGGERTLTYSAGIYAKLLTLCLSCIDLQKIPISGYCLILILLVGILVQAVRTDWFIFIISKRGSGYQAFKLHWTLSIASRSIHFCQWQALHQGIEDL